MLQRECKNNVDQVPELGPRLCCAIKAAAPNLANGLAMGLAKKKASSCNKCHEQL